MKIGLLDVDGHNFPNLPLMKLSAWHKAQGHNVERFFPFNSYDLVYQAKVFTFTEDFQTVVNAKEIIKGGTGYFYPDGGKPLAKEIEHIYPDYDLYNEKTAYGFLTRGCPRGCDFCIVGKKEGLKSRKVANLDEFWRGQKNIELLDPNLLAYKDHKELLQQLIDSKAIVNVNQGFDIRLTTPENIELIRQMKIKLLHFAWDYQKEERAILPKLKQFKELTGINRSKLIVYVLTNFDTTHEYDLYRVETLKSMGYDPYIMIYEKDTAPDTTRKFARYVNNKFIFWSQECKSFEDYQKL